MKFFIFLRIAQKSQNIKGEKEKKPKPEEGTSYQKRWLHSSTPQLKRQAIAFPDSGIHLIKVFKCLHMY